MSSQKKRKVINAAWGEERILAQISQAVIQQSEHLSKAVQEFWEVKNGMPSVIFLPVLLFSRLLNLLCISSYLQGASQCVMHTRYSS
jgi:hypothetical protein